MNHPKVAIVILAWNQEEHTVECLGSILKINYPNYEVILVDNASTDGSPERIAAKFPSVHIIRNKENIGYARGNNVGMKWALENTGCEYVLILNNDIVVDRDFLAPLIEAFNVYPNVGLSGPKIIDYYTKKHWQGPAPWRINVLSTLMFFTPLKHIFIRTPIVKLYLMRGDKPQKVYGVTGCAMLFAADALRDIGLFDEGTFLGWEEYIMAEKLMQKGYSTYAVPKSVIFHKVARTMEVFPATEKTIAFLKSEIYFQNKYLKMPYYKRGIVKLVRAFFYLVAALLKKQYRRDLFRILKVLFEAHND